MFNKYLQLLGLTFILLLGIKGKLLFAKELESLQFYEQEKVEKYLALNQLEEAKELYEQGEFAKAIALLKTAINKSAKAGDILSQIQGLLNLSLIHLQQSNWQETETNLDEVFLLIEKIKDRGARDRLTNYAREIKGELELTVGRPEKALNTWEQSGEIAYHRGDIQRFIRAKIKQIQALQELGMYGRAVHILEDIKPQLEKAPQDLVTAQAWQTVGNIFIKLGQLELAEQALNKALILARKYESNDLIADILLAQGHWKNIVLMKGARQEIAEIETILLDNNLDKISRVNLEKLLKKMEQEIPSKIVPETTDYYRQAVSIARNPFLQVASQLAEINLLVSEDRDNISSISINNLAEKINSLPLEKSLVNYRINLALNLIKLNQSKYNSLILQQLSQAHQESETLNYQRGKSESLGTLAKLYQQSQKLEEARELTERALSIAGQINAHDLAYQWQWQLGKIYYQQNKRKEAISAYSGAVNTLQSLRSEIVAFNLDLEFNFRENVEPVYLELVDILLQPQPPQESQQKLTEEEIKEIKLARDVIDSLQIAELDNYFQDACLDIKEVNLDRVADRETAIFYPIILPDRIEIIVSLPGESIRRYRTKIDRYSLEKEIGTLIVDINEANAATGEMIELNNSLNRLYNYLIQPIAQELPSLGIKNLVFVASGFLKSVPMAALYDGKQYLVENYNIAIAPSLKLVEPEITTKKEIKALLAGLSLINEDNPHGAEYFPLAHVEDELKTLTEIISSTNILFNQTFTQKQFEQAVVSSTLPVVHIATHGRFSSQLADTYLLTWDGEINIDELNYLFRQYTQQKQPVELLVLSACETAVGDRRAALGLAGVAVKASARSTVASLWAVSDESTGLLMGNFYRELVNNPTSSKAEALRLAQLNLIGSHDGKFKHPYFWSAFILIGNWL